VPYLTPNECKELRSALRRKGWSFHQLEKQSTCTSSHLFQMFSGYARVSQKAYDSVRAALGLRPATLTHRPMDRRSGARAARSSVVDSIINLLTGESDAWDLQSVLTPKPVSKSITERPDRPEPMKRRGKKTTPQIEAFVMQSTGHVSDLIQRVSDRFGVKISQSTIYAIWRKRQSA